MSEDYLTLEKLVEKYKPHHNEICLLYGVDLVRLLGVAEEEDDFYYIARKLGLNQHITFHSCVGHLESLKGKIDTYDLADSCFSMNGCPPSEEFIIKKYNGDRDFENSIEGIREKALGNLSRIEIEALGLQELFQASKWSKNDNGQVS